MYHIFSRKSGFYSKKTLSYLTMNWLRGTLHNEGARAIRLKWADFALATSPHVLANVSLCCSVNVVPI